MSTIVRRLRTGADLRKELEKVAVEEDLRSAVVLSAVGSLSSASLRMAGADSSSTFAGPLEIVSITGTPGSGGMHIHLAVSDVKGTTYGGHLTNGCLVHTTVELVIANLSRDWQFGRETDDQTGYMELVFKRQNSST